MDCIVDHQKFTNMITVNANAHETKKVLVLVKQVDGGTGTFVEQLMRLEHISTQPLSVRVVALEKPQFRSNGGISYITYFKNIHQLVRGYPLTLQTVRTVACEMVWLRRQVAINQPDIILSVDTHCNMLACFYKTFLSKNRSLQVILTVHNNISAVVFTKLPYQARMLFQATCRFLFSRADAIVCVSRGVAMDVKRFFSLQQLPLVIPVSVNTQRIRKLASSPFNAGDRFIFQAGITTILSIGRFAPQKDFITLIEAFALLHATKPNTHLCIIGDGPDKEKIVDCIKHYNLEKSVYLLGWKQNVYPYIKASDIFVLSSNYEGFPYVLLEAAALGKPIVATDTPYGPREFLGDNVYGRIVPMKSPGALYHALRLLLEGKVYAKYQRQIQMRIHQYSETGMMRRYLSLVDGLYN